MKPIIQLDCNGVLHRYSQGWLSSGPLYDPPTDGFEDWARETVKEFRLAVWASHMNGPRDLRLIRKWLRRHGLTYLDIDVVAEPPRGVKLKIDDRAERFTGNWDDFPLERLKAFTTWSGR